MPQPIPPSPGNFRLAVLMACHNRRQMTLRCLEALFSQEELEARVKFRVFLFDDGSTDGTAAAVRAQFPEVVIIPGDGTCFWAGGMRRSWEAAMEVGQHHAYLWLNDDTHLDANALNKAFALHQAMALDHTDCILVGAVRDPGLRQLTYGGCIRKSLWRPFQLSLLQESALPIRCDTFNGNFIWVSASVVDRIGILGREFVHAMADVEYGLRARRAGIPSFVIPGTVGSCSKDHGPAPWEDPGLTLRSRWARTIGPKHLPPSAWIRMALRYGGWVAPFIAVWPYLKVLRPTRIGHFGRKGT